MRAFRFLLPTSLFLTLLVVEVQQGAPAGDSAQGNSKTGITIGIPTAAGWVRAAQDRWRRGVRNLQRRFQRAVRTARRNFNNFRKRVARNIKDTGKKVRKWAAGVKKTAAQNWNKAKKWAANVSKTAAKNWDAFRKDPRKYMQKVGAQMKQNFDNFKKSAAKKFAAFKKKADAFWAKAAPVLRRIGLGVLEIFAGPIKIIIAIVKGAVKFGQYARKYGFKGAFTRLFQDFLKSVQKEVKYYQTKINKMFLGFRKVLVMKTFDMKQILAFCTNTMTGLKQMTARLLRTFGVPDLLAEAVGWMTAGPLWPALISGITPLAAITFGIRTAMKFLLPKIIMGVGDLHGKAKNSKVSQVMNSVIKFLMDALGAGGGLLLQFIKNPETKGKIMEVFRKIADVSGKINKGIEGALKVAEAVRTGNFTTIEKALAARSELPSKLGKEDMKKMLNGLLTFARDQLWLLFYKLLRKLTQKLEMFMDRAFDVPRNALIGAVGTIPFAGGVLAGALNYGIGVLLDFIKEQISGAIHKSAEILMKDQWNDIQQHLVKKLTGSKAGRKATKNVLELIKTVGSLAGQLNKQMQIAQQGIQGTIGSLVSTALDKLLLKGIRNADVRKIIAGAVSTVVTELTKGKGFNLKDAILKVLNMIGAPLSRLIASPIPHAGLKKLVSDGLLALIKTLSNPKGVQEIMKNPMGLLTDLAVRLLNSIKDGLASLIMGRLGDHNLKNMVVQAIGTLADTIKSGGFQALLDFKGLMARLFKKIKEPLLKLLTSRLPDKDLKALVHDGLSYVVNKVEEGGLSALLQGGGIKQFFLDLLDHIKEPLVNLVMRGVPSPALRQAALTGLSTLIARLKSGTKIEVPNFLKLVADLLRAMKKSIVAFIAGQIPDKALASAMAVKMEPAADKVAAMVEKGTLKGLLDVIAEVAEPALLHLKAHVTAQLPGGFKAMVGKAFDKVLPLLKTREGRIKLLREGPKMLWTALVDYLKGLLKQAKTLLAQKWQELQDTLRQVIVGLQSGFKELKSALAGLSKLGALLKDVRLPSPS